VAIDDAVSVVAVALTVVFAWPQVFRVLRHGIDGVSADAITLSMVGAAAWLGYGIAGGLAPVIVANFGVLTGQLVVTAELTRKGALGATRAGGAVAAALALLGLSQLDALTDPIVVAAGIVAISSLVAQLTEVVREPHRLEGLSAGTYGILTSVATTWVVYGVLESDGFIIATNIVALPMAAFITRAAVRSHRELKSAKDAT